MSEQATIISRWPGDGLHGRRKIYTHKHAVSAENVAAVVSDALQVHYKNKCEIDYLYNYYKGKQDINGRQKTIRPEIANCVLVNHANEIVTFKTAYLLNEPIQYVSAGNDDKSSEGVKLLSECMRYEGKDAKDNSYKSGRVDRSTGRKYCEEL